MKLSLLQENLQHALAIVQKAISAKPAIPILGGIHLTTHEDTLILSATDMYLGIQTRIPVTVTEAGSVVVPGKLFSETIHALSAGTLNLETTDTALKVSSKNSTSSLQIQLGEEYPEFPLPVDANSANFSLEQLQTISQYIDFAVSTDSTRPVLTSLLFDFSEQQLIVAGTDGFRLALMSFPAAAQWSEQRWLVPVKALSEVCRIAAQEKVTEVTVTLAEESRQLFFQLDTTVLFVRLIDGEYPPYQKIIPTAFNCEVAFDSQELLSHLKQALVFARDASNIVHFEVSGELLTVSAISSTAGNHNSTLPVEVIQAGDGKIAFNARYLQDFLTAAKGQKIIFSMKESLKPAMFKIDGLETYQYVVMPFRVNE